MQAALSVIYISDHFRDRQRPLCPGGGNLSSCPEGDITDEREPNCASAVSAAFYAPASGSRAGVTTAVLTSRWLLPA